MTASRTLYTGDGVITQFNISFPFLSSAHLMIFVNEALQLTPMNYTLSGSTVTFNDAPAQDDAIEFRRNTSPNQTLVDFTNGSVLDEQDLDTAYLHNYYLMQEVTDGFHQLINEALVNVATGAGIVETDTDLVIAALVNEMLQDAAAASLQQRVTDIDNNAEAIIDLGTNLQIQVNTIAQGVAAIVYIQDDEPVPGVGGIPDPITDGARWYDSNDNNAAYIYDQAGTAWLSIGDPRIGQAVSDITVLQADVVTNAAAVVTEQTARANADGAIATDLALLGAANGGDTAFVLNLATVEVVDGVETLAQRFTSITAGFDTNAAGIVTEASARATADSAIATTFALLGAENGAQSAFILNENTVKIDTDGGDTLAQRFSGLSAADSTNAADITTEETARIAADAAEAALRVTLAARVTTTEGDIVTANIDISANVSAISSNDSDITDLYAHYGVTLDVDGYITGFAQNNDGTTGTFVVLADKFGIVTPSTLWAATTAYSVGFNARPTTSNGRVFECTTAGTSGGTEPTWDTTIGNTTADGTVVWTCRDDAALSPFTVSGDKITMNGTVEINGSLLLNGSIVGAALVAGTIGSTQIGANAITTTQLNANAVTANEIAANAITADKINAGEITADKMDISGGLSSITADIGSITAGDITLDSSGYIKGGQTGYNAGTGFFLGYDSSAYKFSIGDGGVSNFITWDGTSLVIRGNISVGSYTASDTIMLSALTERNSGIGGGWVTLKQFEINRPGTVRLVASGKISSTTGGVTTAAQFRWKLDGVVKSTQSFTSTTYSVRTYDMTLLEASQYITIEAKHGWTGGGEPLERACYVKDAYVKGDKSDGESVIID